MKPVQKSASKIIRVGFGYLHANIGRDEVIISQREIRDAFGKVPSKDYKVIYTLSPIGKYLVKKGSKYYCLDKPGKHLGLLAICWLPKGWHGKKVNRRVKILPKRRTK
jgi:hypothetical protein